jgi:hypothetical protein
MKKKPFRWIAWYSTPKPFHTKKEMLTFIGSDIVMYGKIQK